MKKYDVAAYIWPAYTGDEPRTRIFWPEGYGEWQTVKSAVSKSDKHIWPRKPLWGYCNEADPYVMQMQIDAAADHGVNCFIYDWYWFDNRPFLEQCLDNGYLKAKNNDRVKFYIMWANHVATSAWDKRTAHLDVPMWSCYADMNRFRTICERLTEMYFLHPSYYKIDGKPVFQFHDLCNYIVGIGGVDNAKRGIEMMNEIAIKAGLPGVYTQISLRGQSREGFGLSGMFTKNPAALGFDGTVADAVDLVGIDSTTHYQMCGAVDIKRDYLSAFEDMKKTWEFSRQNYKAVYFPHVSLGWDPNPRYIDYRDDILTDCTVGNIKTAFLAARDYIDAHPELPAPLVTVNSWNEWTECSYLEPDDLNGYGYLQALKDVFLGE